MPPRPTPPTRPTRRTMRPRRRANPLAWAALLSGLTILLILVVGLLRLNRPIDSTVAAHSAAAPLPSQGLPPPWPFGGPRLLPQVEEAVAQAPTATVIPSATLMPPTPVPPTPMPTALPAVALPSPTPAALVPALVSVQAPPAATQVTGLRHYWQTWNNCGPATLAMNLSYYGSPLDQADIGNVLRTYADDKNVSPEELVAFAQRQGFHAQLRVNGNADLARTLLANGIPLLIETWLEETPNDGLGHYRLLVGYDDAQASWIGYDSYVSTGLIGSEATGYAGIRMPYDQTAAWWKVFNHTYVLVYPPDREPLVRAILGDAFDPTVMWQEARVRAENDIAADPNDPFAHFNLGTVLVEAGDYAGAAAAYDRARALGLPWRMLWYQFGPFAAYTATGRYQEVLDLGQATLDSAGGGIEEVHYWRGQAWAALGNLDAARAEWNQALTLNPDFAPARMALTN